MSTTMPLVASTTYTFTFSGSSFKNPFPDQANGNSFRMHFSDFNQHLATFVMALPYTSLAVGSLPGTTALCTAIGGRFTGANGGAVSCSLDIPTSSAQQLSSLRIEFTNPSQIKEILPYCEAYILSGSSTPIGGQLVCSRVEISSSQFIINVFGFNFIPVSSFRVLFRARLLTPTLTVSVSLQIVRNAVTSTVFRQSSYNIDVTAVMSGSCKFIIF